MPSDSINIELGVLKRRETEVDTWLTCLHKSTSLVSARLRLIADLKGKQNEEQVVHWSSTQIASDKLRFKFGFLIEH